MYFYAPKFKYLLTMIQIKEILATETYAVRSAVLRKGKPLESCVFPGDELSTTKHFGLFTDNLVGVISLFENKNPKFHDSLQMQIRGMAILEDYQGLNLGAKLITECENKLQSGNNTLIWFNAREKAVGFYKKLGYKTIGNGFDIQDIGLHFIMHKNLRS